MSALIEVRNLHVSRSGAAILKGVSFAAGPGAFIALAGPNGAGKSTLLRALIGLEEPDAGACLIDGAPARALAPLVRARRVAYLPQTRPVYWAMPAGAIVALGRFAYGAPARLEGEDAAAVARALAACDIAHLTARPAHALSGGEAARVHLARALAAETPALLADEPTAALDPRHQLAIMRTLRRRADAGALVIAALHDLALAARFCTRIVLLSEGAIAADGPPETALAPERLRGVFGVRAAFLGEQARPAIIFDLPETD